jgi:hypothetical protein
MKHGADCIVVRNIGDLDRYLGQVREAAAKIHAWVAAQFGNPLDLLRRMKFETAGFQPIQGHPLNLVEQIDQTWTYVVALAAGRHLLEMRPEAGDYVLAPAAHAAVELDIMSEAPGLIGADTFAAVDPSNSKKLETGLPKLAVRTEQHRYSFLMSPGFPGFKRLRQWERNGIQVWSVDV